MRRRRRERYWGTHVTVLRELPDGTEQEIEVDCRVTPGERQYFDALKGEGHPGSGPEAEVERATLHGVEVELTDDEIEYATDTAVERYVEDTGDPRY